MRNSSSFNSILRLCIFILSCSGILWAKIKKPSNIISIKNSVIYTTSIKDSIVKDSSFIIKDYPSNSYSGHLKDGKPYKGYFKRDISEHTIVDYYEKGKKLFQYSNDYLKKIIEDEEKLINEDYYNYNEILDITSSYKKGKIYTGYEYTDHKNGFTTKKIKKGNIEFIHIDVFAIHYFNRITIKEVNGAIELTFLNENNSKIRVESHKNRLSCSLVVNDKVVAYKTNKTFNFAKIPKKSSIHCSISNNIPLTVVMNDDSENTHSAISSFFEHISLIKFENIKDFYQELKIFNKNKESITETEFTLAYVETNENGKIENGIYWEYENGGQYHEYLKNVYLGVKKSSLKNFQNAVELFFKKTYEK